MKRMKALNLLEVMIALAILSLVVVIFLQTTVFSTQNKINTNVQYDAVAAAQKFLYASDSLPYTPCAISGVLTGEIDSYPYELTVHELAREQGRQLLYYEMKIRYGKQVETLELITDVST